MAIKKLSVDQKLDLVISKVSELETNVSKLGKSVVKLETSFSKLENSVGKLENSVEGLKKGQLKIQQSIDDLTDMSSQTLLLAGKTADKVSHIESHLAKSSDFIPFNGGAFAA